MSAVLTSETPAPGITILTLNRPETLNALSWELIEGLGHELERIAGDPEIRVLIVTGAGRGFCSGLDLGAEGAVGVGSDVTTILDRQELIAELAVALHRLPQPVIAAVNGPAAGGGMALALAADVRLFSEHGRMNVAFVRLGLSGCDIGVSYFLPRLVGPGLAAEWMLTGRQIDVGEAAASGLANRVVDHDRLLPEALELADEIARNSPFGVRMTKQVLASNVDAPSLRAALELENRTQVLATQTADCEEAVAAFRDRRRASFTGR